MSSFVDGFSLKELFINGKGLTYDDVVILPGYIDFLPSDVNLNTKFTKEISLSIPLVTSPMDTVTEFEVAKTIALHGGIGIIHHNNTIEEQAKMVYDVKKFKQGFISNPVVIHPDFTMREFFDYKSKYNFSGFPVTDTGLLCGKLLGMVTNRDVDFFVGNKNIVRVKDIMTPFDKLVTGPFGISLSKAKELLSESRKGKLPIIDEEGRLIYLLARTDISKAKEFPNASLDSKSQLMVGAAISTLQKDEDRLCALSQKGVDVVVLDSSQGNSSYQLECLRKYKLNYPKIQFVAGNVVTVTQAQNLISAGADCIRIGMGSGSICITQEALGVGRAQGSAVYSISQYCHEQGVPTIADGGIRSFGDIVKACAFGASTVMLGSLIAGTSEAPGQYHVVNGVRVKAYRGMGSLNALEYNAASRSRYSADEKILVAQGVSGTVLDKGSLHNLIPKITTGVQHGLQDIGVKSLDDLRMEARNGAVRFEIRSTSSKAEGKVHTLHSHENYSI